MGVRSKTPKELAEATAATALDSLRAALVDETSKRDELRAARRDGLMWDVEQDERKLRDAVKRSDAAFKAWRAACEAVPS